MRISLIAAVAENNVIGDGFAIPWHLPEDLKIVKNLTLKHVVIMGRRTWESIGKPLPNRLNIVLSTTMDRQKLPREVLLFPSLAEALDPLMFYPDVFILGGARLYEEALPLADRLCISKVPLSPKGSVKFPEVDWSLWMMEKEEPHEGFTYTQWVRR